MSAEYLGIDRCPKLYSLRDGLRYAQRDQSWLRDEFNAVGKVVMEICDSEPASAGKELLIESAVKATGSLCSDGCNVILRNECRSIRERCQQRIQRIGLVVNAGLFDSVAEAEPELGAVEPFCPAGSDEIIGKRCTWGGSEAEDRVVFNSGPQGIMQAVPHISVDLESRTVVHSVYDRFRKSRRRRVTALVFVFESYKSDGMRIDAVIGLSVKHVTTGGVEVLIGIGPRKLEFCSPTYTVSVGSSDSDRSSNVQVAENRAVVRNPGRGVIGELAAQPQAAVPQQVVPPVCELIFQRDTHKRVLGFLHRVVRDSVQIKFLSNGAAINVLARLHGAELIVVDVGVAADFRDVPGMLHRKVRAGTRNMLHEPAMTEEELAGSLQVGLDLAATAHREGRALIAVGEMGIGNTTAASAITAALTERPIAAVTGKGTGLDAQRHAHKVRVLESIMEKHFGGGPVDISAAPLQILRRVGGLEISAMTGMVLGAAAHRIGVVADGFISTSAAALAYAIAPSVRDYLFAGHRSDEPGHRFLHEYIGLQPILSIDMRLGEGTGAVLAMPVIESAVRLYEEMATFASAGVSGARA